MVISIQMWCDHWKNMQRDIQKMSIEKYFKNKKSVEEMSADFDARSNWSLAEH